MAIRYLIGYCVMFLTPYVYADTIQSLDKVEQAVYMHALNDALASYDNPQVIVEPMDKRLRLQACNNDFETFANTPSNTLGKRTIGVRCQAPEVWTVYVPVKVKVMRPVVVAARPLTANQIVHAADIKMQQMDISDLRKGYLQSDKLVVGQQMRYSLSVGMVVLPSSLQSKNIVRRGEMVTIMASAGSMEVRVKGIAMDDASVGEVVRVKNNSSKRVVEGIAHAEGIVKVAM